MKNKIPTTILLILAFATFFAAAPKAEAARLYLKPPTGKFTQGQEFQVQIMLDTEGQQTAGTDIYLNYDPKIIQATTIQEGTIYNTYLGKNIDNQTGTVSLSGIISIDSETGYSGTGTFATIVFKGVSVGTSQVNFDYTPGDKNDSNVAVLDLPDDNLTKATGATYTITATGGDTGGDNSNEEENNNGGIGGNGGTTPAELPRSGSVGNTLKIIGAGLGTLLISLIFLL